MHDRRRAELKSRSKDEQELYAERARAAQAKYRAKCVSHFVLNLYCANRCNRNRERLAMDQAYRRQLYVYTVHTDTNILTDIIHRFMAPRV
jgi:hypothetical protein